MAKKRYPRKPRLPNLQQNDKLANGLILCLPFFERGGSIVHDHSKNKTHATARNSPTWVINSDGYVMNFSDTGDQYLDIPQNTKHDITNGFTFSIGFQLNGVPAEYDKLIQWGVNKFQLIFDQSGTVLKLYFQDSGAVDHYYDIADMGDLLPHHILGSYNNLAGLKVWVDGELKVDSAAVGTINTATGLLYIATEQQYYAHTPCKIGHLFFWNYALSKSAIYRLVDNPWTFLTSQKRTVSSALILIQKSLAESGAVSDAITIVAQDFLSETSNAADTPTIKTFITATDASEGGESGLILHSNDFSSTDLSLLYDIVAGEWSVTGGVLYNTSGGGSWNSRVIITKKTDYKNFEIYCRLKKPQDNNAQIIFRTGGDNNGYGIQLREASNFRLEHWGISNLVNVTPLTYVEGGWYKVRIRVEGDRIRARRWEDVAVEPVGTWQIDTTQTNFSSGAIGFSAEGLNSAFDEIVVTEIGPQVTQLYSVSDSGSLNDALTVVVSFALLEAFASSDVLAIDQGSNVIT